MSFGRYYEEFEEGQQFRHWPGRTVSEVDNTWFSLLTMNQHPLHIDSYYASQTQHGKCLIVGTLVFSIAVGMSVADISGRAIANLSYEDVKHLAPVFAGDTIYASSMVLGKRESTSKPDRGVVSIETTARNQNEQTVLSFRRQVLIPRRPVEQP